MNLKGRPLSANVEDRRGEPLFRESTPDLDLLRVFLGGDADSGAEALSRAREDLARQQMMDALHGKHEMVFGEADPGSRAVDMWNRHIERKLYDQKVLEYLIRRHNGIE